MEKTPAIVCEDHSEDPPISPTLLIQQRKKRLPGRGISVSSSEDEDYEQDITSLAARIEIVQDPAFQQPRKPSLVTSNLYQSIPRSASCHTNDKFGKSTKFDLPAEAEDDQSPSPPTRKRSVSFSSLAKHKVEQSPDPEPPSGVPSANDSKVKISVHDVDEAEVFDTEEEGDDANRLKVRSSERAKERRKSIESLVRPPTPPNSSHTIKN